MPNGKSIDLINGPAQEAMLRSQAEVAGFNAQFAPQQLNPVAQLYKDMGIRLSMLRDK